MSGEEGPWLLVRDRLQLNDVAAAIREGQRYVAFLVCEPQFRPLALEYLREQAQQSILDPVALVDPDQTLQVLTEIANSPATVHSFLVVHTAPDVVRTLNWHREKLRRGNVVLLWIEGVEGLRTLRQLGPDAYSFRDTLVMIQGEMPVPVVPAQEESVDVQLARLRYSAAETPIEKAIAAANFANQLAAGDRRIEAQQIVQDAFTELDERGSATEAERIIYANLCWVTGSIFPNGVHAHRWFNRGLDKLNGSESLDATMVRIGLLAAMPTPGGANSTSVLRALAELHKMQMFIPQSQIVNQVPALGAVADMWARRGDTRRARQYFRDAREMAQFHPTNLHMIYFYEAQFEIQSGRFHLTMQLLSKLLESLRQRGMSTFGATCLLASCHRMMGERNAAQRIFEDILKLDGNGAFACGANSELGYIALHSNASQSLAEQRKLLRELLDDQNDAHILVASTNYKVALLLAYEAQRTTDSDITDALTDLNLAESVACSIAGDDPPWYSILFPALRAELLALRPETVEKAISLVSTALDRARIVFEDAVPKLARQLVHHLLQAGHLERARDALPSLIDEIASVRHLSELVRLRAYQIVTFVRLNAPTADVDIAMQALRANFEEMDAPRIAADALLELAEMLPPTSTHVDPCALADEAASLYAEMPYPFQEARALEVMGDVLEGRGKADEALNCYRSSRGICEKFGLGLRMPLLDLKITACVPTLLKS